VAETFAGASGGPSTAGAHADAAEGGVQRLERAPGPGQASQLLEDGGQAGGVGLRQLAASPGCDERRPRHLAQDHDQVDGSHHPDI